MTDMTKGSNLKGKDIEVFAFRERTTNSLQMIAEIYPCTPYLKHLQMH